LSASMDLPSSVSANNEVTATVTVEGIHEDPINGLSVILTANGTERASTTTTAKGKAILVFSISAGTYNITCATQNHADYYRDVSISQILIVRSTTQLTLSQADLHYYGTCLVSALLKDELGNPVPHKLIDFMISIDQGITWTFLGANMTGDNGQGLISWFNELLPLTSGNYLIKASFAGSFHYEPSLTSIEVEIHRYEVVASWDRFTLVDGETVNYTITASDSNGISNISIIRQNETILVELSDNDTAEGELRFYAPGTYCVQVIITDMAGLMTTTNFTFIVEGKGPKFISVYPSDTILNEMRSPVLLEVEAIVADPSGISQIILHTNSTGYPLTFTNGMWCTSLELSNATYSLWLTAIDIYGVESRYELGQITPFLNKTAIANDEGDGTRNIQSVKEDSASPFLMLGVLTLSLTVLIGNFISKWRRRNYL
ncbi:MAG: Ig-like domain-containing protein, partial [Promethearchaeota archaeon]